MRSTFYTAALLVSSLASAMVSAAPIAQGLPALEERASVNLFSAVSGTSSSTMCSNWQTQCEAACRKISSTATVGVTCSSTFSGKVMRKRVGLVCTCGSTDLSKQVLAEIYSDISSTSEVASATSIDSGNQLVAVSKATSTTPVAFVKTASTSSAVADANEAANDVEVVSSATATSTSSAATSTATAAAETEEESADDEELLETSALPTTTASSTIGKVAVHGLLPQNVLTTTTA